jgi:phage/conjugal plasmid C-4 type zinc finger TraR family protein
MPKKPLQPPHPSAGSWPLRDLGFPSPGAVHRRRETCTPPRWQQFTFTGLCLPLDRDEEQEGAMATGWAGDNAVQDQIDATVEDAIKRARSQLPQGPGLAHCEECGASIPEARRKAMPGVRLCVSCQEALDRDQAGAAGYNRRGSKDSQLR